MVQIWPGHMRLVYTEISPGHIWTTLYLSKSKRTPPKLNTCLETIFYYEFHTHNTRNMSDSIYLYLSVSFSLYHSQCLHLPNVCSYILILVTHSTTYHHQSHSLHWYITLLKTLNTHLWWDVLSCYCDRHWLNNRNIYWFINFLEPSKFYHGSGVKNCKCMCSGHLCCVCGVTSLSSWLFLWFLICILSQVLFLSLVVNF